MAENIIVKEPSTGEYEEKKSRFIAGIYPVNNEAEVASIIESVRKKYWDARHNCYAFVIGDNNEMTRCSDDGEPAGTAGKPILEVITKSELHNCLIIVTRYFGGTLLGTGGLVRAYTQASKEAVSNCRLAKKIPGVLYNVTTDYNGIGKIQYAMANMSAQIKDTVYTDIVRMEILIEKEREEMLIKEITETTNGRAVIEKNCDLPIEIEINL